MVNSTQIHNQSLAAIVYRDPSGTLHTLRATLKRQAFCSVFRNSEPRLITMFLESHFNQWADLTHPLRTAEQ